MNSTNINITDGSKIFNYFVEYIDSVPLDSVAIQYAQVLDEYSMYPSNVMFFNEFNADREQVVYDRLSTTDDVYLVDVNRWTQYISEYARLNVPFVGGTANVHTATLRVYFPQFSVDTYQRGTKYMLCASVWLEDTRVELGRYIFTRNNAVANAPKRILNNEYVEHVDIRICDAWDIVYGDAWKPFRESLRPQMFQSDTEYNNVGAQLSIELLPVETTDDGKYILTDTWHAGENVIRFTNKNADLRVAMALNFDTPQRSVDCSLLYNDVYSSAEFPLYLEETYGIPQEATTQIHWELSVKSNTDIYKYLGATTTTDNISQTFLTDALAYTDWSEYTDGLFFVCIATVQVETDTDVWEDVLQVVSTEMPILPTTFAYIMVNNDQLPQQVDLNNVENMNITELNVVNKIEKTIVNFERPADYKTGLTKPVFYSVKELQRVLLHPEVTENIALNLDTYKNKVTCFYVQIEGVQFKEIARTGNGVIFTIRGNELPKEQMDGTYYILNESKELVTTGQYMYIS